MLTAFLLVWAMFPALDLMAADTRSRLQRNDKLERAILFSGHNLNTSLFLGMLDGVLDAGKAVDVIVASCGGAIGAAVVHAIPEPSERLEFVKSPEFHQYLRTIELNDVSLPEFLRRRSGIRRVAAGNSRKRAQILRREVLAEEARRPVPDVFEFALMKFEPRNVPDRFHVPIVRDGIRIVIVAARLEFSREDVGQLRPFTEPLFTETYFTDEHTARLLMGVPSFTASAYPLSAMAADTSVVSGVNLAHAVGASVADPIVVKPIEIEGQLYMTGAVNIDPVAVAKRLAHEVIARYPTPWDGFLEQPILMATFGFDGNAVRALVTGGEADYWIDVTDGDFPSLSPGGKFNLTANPARTIAFRSGVPEAHEDYVRIVEAQYRYGRARAKEAVANPGSKSHIRMPIEK